MAKGNGEHAKLVESLTARWQATIVMLAVVGAVIFLSYEDKIDGQATVGILTAILSIVGTVFAVSKGVQQGSQASTNPPPSG